MTCAVILVHGDAMWAGSDSSASNENTMYLSGEGTHKVFAKKIAEETCLVAGAGSYRFMGLIEHRFIFPALPLDPATPEAMMRWLVVDVIDEIRAVLKTGGLLSTKDSVESTPGILLLGVRGKVYQIGADLSVRSVAGRFGAIGSGAAEAQGFLSGFEKLKLEIKIDPEVLIRTALSSSELYTPSVRGPCKIIKA